LGFVDSEKAIDRVPREVIRWEMLSWELKNGQYRQVKKQLSEHFVVTLNVLTYAPRFSIESIVISDCHGSNI